MWLFWQCILLTADFFPIFWKKLWRDYKSILLLHQEANTISISLPGGGRVNHRHTTPQCSTLWEGSQVQASFILPQHMLAETFALQCNAPLASPQLMLGKEGKEAHTTGTWHSHKKLTHHSLCYGISKLEQNTDTPCPWPKSYLKHSFYGGTFKRMFGDPTETLESTGVTKTVRQKIADGSRQLA